MKGLILLALLGLAVADEDWDMLRKRLDAREMRIARIKHEIEELEHNVDGDDERPYNLVVGELERRLARLEESDCDHDHEFSCGRASGECVHDLLVCDQHNDCSNGHDEDEDDTCHNQAPAGRSWEGTAHWSACVNRRENEMSLLITGNRRMKHFPSRLWIDAVIIDKWVEDHETKTHTWNSHGYYDYAHKRIVLEPPDGSEKRIAMTCDDAGEGIADCTMMRESNNAICGHAVLTRPV